MGEGRREKGEREYISSFKIPGGLSSREGRVGVCQ